MSVGVSVGVSVVNMVSMGASTAGVLSALSEESAGVVIVGEVACMVAG